MLDFLTKYGADILAGVIAVAGAITSICATLKLYKTEKRVKASEEQTKEDIAVTQEGIVQAFKQAKIPNELKISLSNQVTTILTNFENKVLELFREQERLRTSLVLFCTKIMSNTAAYGKLTEEEKTALEELMKEINEADKIVEIEPEE